MWWSPCEGILVFLVLCIILFVPEHCCDLLLVCARMTLLLLYTPPDVIIVIVCIYSGRDPIVMWFRMYCYWYCDNWRCGVDVVIIVVILLTIVTNLLFIIDYSYCVCCVVIFITMRRDVSDMVGRGSLVTWRCGIVLGIDCYFWLVCPPHSLPTTACAWWRPFDPLQSQPGYFIAPWPITITTLLTTYTPTVTTILPTPHLLPFCAYSMPHYPHYFHTHLFCIQWATLQYILPISDSYLYTQLHYTTYHTLQFPISYIFTFGYTHCSHWWVDWTLDTHLPLRSPFWPTTHHYSSTVLLGLPHYTIYTFHWFFTFVCSTFVYRTLLLLLHYGPVRTALHGIFLLFGDFGSYLIDSCSPAFTVVYTVLSPFSVLHRLIFAAVPLPD